MRTTLQRLPIVLAALCAALPLAANAQSPQMDDYIHCAVELVDSMGNLSIDFAPNFGDLTVWDLGEVPEGGTADTWFDDDGPGSFVVRNSGDVPAFIWLVAQEGDGGTWPPEWNSSIGPTNALPTGRNYAVAYANNFDDLVPDWMLFGVWFDYQFVGQPLDFARPGESLLFDLKFFAPDEYPFPAPPVEPESETLIFRVGAIAVEDGGPPGP